MTRWRWSMSTMAPGLPASQPSVQSGEVPQVPERLPKGLLAQVERPLVRAVLDLHAYGAIVTGVGQDGEEAAPVHLSQPRQLRPVVLEGSGHDADVVELLRVEAHVLRVDVEEAVLELAER